jgi:hypothetical protein
MLFLAGIVHQRPRGRIIVHYNKGNIAFSLFSWAFSKAITYYNAASRTFSPNISKLSNSTFALEIRTTVHPPPPQHHQQQPKTMLSSIFISALLAGPAVAGVIPRQNTVTVKHTVVTSVVATSTVFSPYVPSSAAELGLNPINGLPAAPPQRPSSSPVPKRLGTTPLVFSTFTSSKGAAAPTATNNPSRILLPAPLTSLPHVTKSSSSAAHPSSYSSLSRAPPQNLPTPPPVSSITPEPEQTSTKAPSKPKSSTTTPPPPPPPPPPAPTETKTEDEIPSDLAALFTSKDESTNPYPYPTPKPKEPKEPKPSNYVYPYPPKQ